MNDHSACNFAYRQVTCDRCGKTYRCTPFTDYYCAPEGDHCCEACLLDGRQIAVIDIDSPLPRLIFRDPT